VRSPEAHRGKRLLLPGTAPVWWMPTDQVAPDHCDRWFVMLDRKERERAERFRFEHDRRDFIAAHVLLRSMLTFYLGRPAAGWRFTADDVGKPRIAQKFRLSEIDFNLSHTRDLVAAAVVSRAAIGVDVEQVDAAKADFDLAQNYFAPAEVDILRATPRPEQATCFFRLWTLKEAYLKATGAGLGTRLDSFAFTLAPVRISFLTDLGDLPQRWHFATLPTTGRHVLSVAIASQGDRPVRVMPRAVEARDL
jgi:4'-phosphopantetheinyl transferase